MFTFIPAHRDPDPLRRGPKAAPGDPRPVWRGSAQDTVPHWRGRGDPWQLRTGNQLLLLYHLQSCHRIKNDIVNTENNSQLYAKNLNRSPK